MTYSMVSAKTIAKTVVKERDLGIHDDIETNIRAYITEKIGDFQMPDSWIYEICDEALCVIYQTGGYAERESAEGFDTIDYALRRYIRKITPINKNWRRTYKDVLAKVMTYVETNDISYEKLADESVIDYLKSKDLL